MFSILYPISYIISLSGLIAWFFCQDKPAWSRLVSKLFLGGFFAYLFSIGMAEAAMEYKLFILFRDLIIMGVVSQIFNLFRQNTLLFFGLLAGFYGLFATKGAAILEQTFPQQTASIGISALDIDEQGELLVELKEQAAIEAIQTVLEKYEMTAGKAFQMASPDITNLDNYFVVNIPKKSVDKLSEIEEALYQTGAVDWVEENEIIRLSPMESTPIATNTDAKKKFGINDPGIGELWGFDAMNVDHLYQGLSKSNIQPKRKALIAILDTGVDSKHEDLADNFISIHEKHNKDDRGHGTHCAGIAASVTNNNKGIASFSLNNGFVNITSIQVLSGFGIGTQQRILDGMILAADKGADVISMSLGGLSNPARQKAYENTVKYCNDKGAIIVVAAGNSNKDAINYTPANVKGVITVSAIDQDINRATFSNFVTNVKMGVAAPGVGIYSTIPGDKYATFNGTSMATPYVAGLVGVLKSIQPDLTTKEVYKILNKTGKATNATKETGKLIQPAKALEMVMD